MQLGYLEINKFKKSFKFRDTSTEHKDVSALPDKDIITPVSNGCACVHVTIPCIFHGFV